MSGATVGMARPPMGPGMGGGVAMEPPVVVDTRGMGVPRRKKILRPTEKPNRPNLSKLKPVLSDPMNEIMGGARPVKPKKEMV